jgi:hypothetical protein
MAGKKAKFLSDELAYLTKDIFKQGVESTACLLVI